MRFLLVFLFFVSLMGPGPELEAQANRTEAADVFSSYDRQASLIAASLNDGDLAAQALLTGIEGKRSLSPAMRSLLERIPAGGIMLFRYNLDSSKEDVKKLLSEASSLVARSADIPPFMAVDHEGGPVHRFGPGVERLPAAFSFWELAQKEGGAAALARAEILYKRSAEEIRGLGVNLVLGPVAETLNRENRAFLEARSYGPEPEFTQAAASAYIRSMDAAGIAGAVKHFPGNTGIDPHGGTPVLNSGKAALDEMVKPFAGIIAGLSPQAVMVSHVVVPAIDSRTNASLSRPVIEGWLRGELGFKGMVIADDFSMGAVSSSGLNNEQLAVEALNAGVDMIMVWPKNIAQVHAAILEALGKGRLSRTRLEEAARRVIAGKLRYGLVAFPK